MSATADTSAVAISQYLATSYRPDREYIEGELLERHVGEYQHSNLQGLLIEFIGSYRKALNIRALPEQRVQVTKTRFRIPDVCVVPTGKLDSILTAPPLLCIEILSRDDRMSEMQERIDDYLEFGVLYVWVLDPRRKQAYVFTPTGASQAKEFLRTADPAISIPLAELFV